MIGRKLRQRYQIIKKLGAGGFSEGLARINIDKKCGYIDQTEQVVIQPQFDWAERFCEELAAVKIDKKWGYIDKSGQLVIQPQFDWAKEFSEGLAAIAYDINWKFGYINKIGRIIIQPQFEDAGNFHGGIAWIRIEEKQRYIDTKGRFIDSPWGLYIKGNYCTNPIWWSAKIGFICVHLWCQ